MNLLPSQKRFIIKAQIKDAVSRHARYTQPHICKYCHEISNIKDEYCSHAPTRPAPGMQKIYTIFERIYKFITRSK